VAYHGHPRTTGDIDIFVEPNESNAGSIINALEAFGFGGLDISMSDLTMENKVIQLGFPPLRIDIMTTVDGLNFAQAWKNRIETVFDGVPVFVMSLEDLIKNKTAAHRAQDIADIDNLSG
jgi:predicted nucleotidyltransferase